MSESNKLNDITNTTSSQIESKPMEKKVKEILSINLKNIFSDPKLFSDENFIIRGQDMDQLKHLDSYQRILSMESERLKASPDWQQTGNRRKGRQYSPYSLKSHQNSDQILNKSDKEEKESDKH